MSATDKVLKNKLIALKKIYRKIASANNDKTEKENAETFLVFDVGSKTTQDYIAQNRAQTLAFGERETVLALHGMHQTTATANMRNVLPAIPQSAASISSSTIASAEENVASILQLALQKCLDRKAYNEEALLYYQKAPVAELSNYCKRNYRAYKVLSKGETAVRAALCGTFEARIKTYNAIVNCLQKLSIDEAFLFSKLETLVPVHNKLQHANRNKSGTIKEEQETVFLEGIIYLLQPYISKTLRLLIKKSYITFDPGSHLESSGGIWTNGKLLTDELIDGPCQKLGQLFISSSGKGVGMLGPNREKYYIEHEEPQFFAIQIRAYEERDKFKAKIDSIPEGTNESVEGLVQTAMVYKECLLSIRSIMKPIRERFYRMSQELALHKMHFEIIEVANQYSTLKRCCELIEKEGKPPKPPNNIKSYGFDEQVWNPIEAKINDLNMALKSLVYQDSIDEEGLKTFEYMLYQLNFYTRQLERQCESLDRFVNQFDLKTAKLKNSAITDAAALSAVLNQNMAAVKEGQENENVVSFKREKRSIPPVKILSKAEWLAQVGEKRRLKEANRKQTLQSLGRVALEEMDIDVVQRQMKGLSEAEFKLRQERVAMVSALSDSAVQAMFQKLYDFYFGQDDVENLVALLKARGVKISIEEGGTSHYRIKIQGIEASSNVIEQKSKMEGVAAATAAATAKPMTATAVTKTLPAAATAATKPTFTASAIAASSSAAGAPSNFSESGPAFKEHAKNQKAKPNNKCLDTHIIRNIQSVFWFSGFTPEALGIKASNKFDPTRFKYRY